MTRDSRYAPFAGVGLLCLLMALSLLFKVDAALTTVVVTLLVKRLRGCESSPDGDILEVRVRSGNPSRVQVDCSAAGEILIRVSAGSPRRNPSHPAQPNKAHPTTTIANERQ